MKGSLPSPPSQMGSVECKHSELHANDHESAVVHNQGLRFYKCSELFKDDEFTVVHSQP